MPSLPFSYHPLPPSHPAQRSQQCIALVLCLLIYHSPGLQGKSVAHNEVSQ